MTIEQADKIADIILSAPKVYDSPPTMFPEVVAYANVVRNSAWAVGFLEGSVPYILDNVYSCEEGFSGSGYYGEIKDWKATPIKGGSYAPRYITVDDIKMMAYVGIENYRAKALGHRWRFNEKGVNTVNNTEAYFRGAIVRQDDGKRWIKCTTNNFTTPIPGVTIGNNQGTKGGTSSVDPLKWSAFTRRGAFTSPSLEYVPLLEGVNIPFDKVTHFIKAATIVGHNDLVKLQNIWAPPYVTSLQTYSQTNQLNYEGQMVVRISEEDRLDTTVNLNDADSKSIIWAESNSIPVNRVSYRDQAGETINMISYDEIYVPPSARSVWKRTESIVGFHSSFVPLQEGRTYYIYIGRTDSRAYFNSGIHDMGMQGGNLSVVRVPTTTIAPKF